MQSAHRPAPRDRGARHFDRGALADKRYRMGASDEEGDEHRGIKPVAYPVAMPQAKQPKRFYCTSTHRHTIRKLLPTHAKADRGDLTAADRKALTRLVAEIKRDGASE